MKFQLKNIAIAMIAAVALLSCSNDDEPTIVANELEGLTKIKEVSNDTHIIELYSHSGITEQGYNEIKLRIKNKSNNQYEKNAEISL